MDGESEPSILTICGSIFLGLLFIYSVSISIPCMFYVFVDHVYPTIFCAINIAILATLILIFCIIGFYYKYLRKLKRKGPIKLVDRI